MALNALVIDDNKQPRLIDTLKKRGFLVDQAYNGTDALDIFLSKQYSLVIVDYEMPGMLGPEVANKLRKQDKEIFMIGYSGHWDSNNICCGLDDYAVYDIEERIDCFLEKYCK